MPLRMMPQPPTQVVLAALPGASLRLDALLQQPEFHGARLVEVEGGSAALGNWRQLHRLMAEAMGRALEMVVGMKMRSVVAVVVAVVVVVMVEVTVWPILRPVVHHVEHAAAHGVLLTACSSSGCQTGRKNGVAVHLLCSAQRRESLRCEGRKGRHRSWFGHWRRGLVKSEEGQVSHDVLHASRYRARVPGTHPRARS